LYHHLVDVGDDVNESPGSQRSVKLAIGQDALDAIVTMRHRLIRGYFDVDADIIWRTATEEVPALIPHLRDLEASD
jgi:uncharacterized protein with HEPN domain